MKTLLIVLVFVTQTGRADLEVLLTWSAVTRTGHADNRTECNTLARQIEDQTRDVGVLTVKAICAASSPLRTEPSQ